MTRDPGAARLVARLVADMTKPTFLYRFNRAQQSRGEGPLTPKQRAANTMVERAEREIREAVKRFVEEGGLNGLQEDQGSGL